MIRIKETVDRISSIYQTYDPFEICAGMGILVARISLTESVRGICYTDENGMAAGINEDLPLHIAKFVCAHELGHLVMHRGMNKGCGVCFEAYINYYNSVSPAIFDSIERGIRSFRRNR